MTRSICRSCTTLPAWPATNGWQTLSTLGPIGRTVEDTLHDLDALSRPELLELATVAKSLGFTGGAEALDSAASPRGFRLLAKVPRLPGTVIDRLVEHFGGLQKLLAASVADLQAVEGVGETRARAALTLEACYSASGQLTRQAEGRQVKDAKLGLVSGFGMINFDRGLGSGAAILGC